MVIFRTSEGKSGYHQAEALEEAVRFVERIRNEEGVEQARIFRLEEVVFEFRPYFRVELSGAPAPAAAVAPRGETSSADTGSEAHDDGAEPADGTDSEQNGETAAAGGRKGLFR